MNSAPGTPSTAVISSHSPGGAGRCPARYSTSTSSSRSASSGKPGTLATGRPGPAGSPGTLRCRPCRAGSGACRVSSHGHAPPGLGDGLVAPARPGRATRGRRAGGSCTAADPRPTPRGTSSPAAPPRPGTSRAVAPRRRRPFPRRARRRCAGRTAPGRPAAPRVPGRAARAHAAAHRAAHGPAARWPACTGPVACPPRGLDHPARPERACTTPHGQAAGTDTHRPRPRGRLHGRRDQA